jgi:hypothetical protein
VAGADELVVGIVQLPGRRGARDDRIRNAGDRDAHDLARLRVEGEAVGACADGDGPSQRVATADLGAADDRRREHDYD